MELPRTWQRIATPLLRTTRPLVRPSIPRSRPSAPWRSQHGREPIKYENPADDPAFLSVADQPARIVKMRGGSKLGVVILALMPITAFGLGTWQIYRLKWKTDLIAKFEDRLIRDPLPLPPSIDQDAVKEFDYRRVTATGKLRNDQEMLVGPRVRDGHNGWSVITPLERKDGTTILICRGWISKDKTTKQSRPEGLPQGEIVVEGLLREPFKKNMFTPENKPDEKAFYFPDIPQMAELTGSQPVWIEETMTPDLLTAYDRESKGIPIGRPAEVNLRNNHTQYIFTWYSLSAATTVMLWMLLKKPPSTANVRRTSNI